MAEEFEVLTPENTSVGDFVYGGFPCVCPIPHEDWEGLEAKQPIGILFELAFIGGHFTGRFESYFRRPNGKRTARFWCLGTFRKKKKLAEADARIRLLEEVK